LPRTGSGTLLRAGRPGRKCAADCTTAFSALPGVASFFCLPKRTMPVEAGAPRERRLRRPFAACRAAGGGLTCSTGVSLAAFAGLKYDRDSGSWTWVLITSKIGPHTENGFALNVNLCSGIACSVGGEFQAAQGGTNVFPYLNGSTNAKSTHLAAGVFHMRVMTAHMIIRPHKPQLQAGHETTRRNQGLTWRSSRTR